MYLEVCLPEQHIFVLLSGEERNIKDMFVLEKLSVCDNIWQVSILQKIGTRFPAHMLVCISLKH